MKSTISPWWALVLGALAGACAGSGSGGRSAAPDELGADLLELETEVPAPPERRPRPDDLAVPFTPREIPRALTATVALREDWPGGRLTRETYRLSPDATSCTCEDGEEIWLARNPRHRDELSGARTHPGERLVLHHTAGDLRLTGMQGLWDRFAALGGVTAPPAGLQPTARVETRFGLDFTLWQAADEAATVRELWWNEEHALALCIAFQGPQGSLVREIETLEWGGNPEALRHPSERHPDWVCLELSDWHDACGPAAAHTHGSSAGGEGHD